MFLNNARTYNWNFHINEEGGCIDIDLSSENWQAHAVVEEGDYSLSFTTPNGSYFFDGEGMEPALKGTAYQNDVILSFSRPQHMGLFKRLRGLRHPSRFLVATLHYKQQVFEIYRKNHLDYFVLGPCGNCLAELASLEERISLFVREEEREFSDVLLLYMLVCGVTSKAFYLGINPTSCD